MQYFAVRSLLKFLKIQITNNLAKLLIARKFIPIQWRLALFPEAYPLDIDPSLLPLSPLSLPL